MKDYLKLIEEKIKKNLEVDNISIKDNSHRHEGHSSFSNQMYHLTLEIESKSLKKLNRIEAQRLVMKILKDDLKTKIHALEIRIK
tara:strand:+ start:1633 stop:1887 length:255 start_codon:yes stop_codon:yes gene_type:complete